jgi:hypothetical protein
VDTETELALYDGRKLPIRLAANIIVNGKRETIGAYSSFFDMTQRVTEQKQLEKQRAHVIQVGGDVSGLAERVASVISQASEEARALTDKSEESLQAIIKSIEDIAMRIFQLVAE